MFNIKYFKNKITAVIPAFNEEKTIGNIIDSVRQFSDEILVVLAKKSFDKTEKIAKSRKIRILRDNGKGKGDGMQCAIEVIKKGIIVFIDSDGSHIPKDIPKLVRPIDENKADMVIGSRFLGGSQELHGNFNKFLRIFYSICISQIINWRFKTAIMDSQNGFRAIRADVAKNIKLTSNHTDIETEMDIKCYKKGYRVLEVPSMELRRKYGKSKISLSRHGFKYFWTVVKNIFW